jgi:ABC-2 type transport system ATP-binding protein
MSDLAISVRDLSKVYGDQISVSHASFDVPLGSVCGFVGPNGAGKTTTIRMLLGLITPTGGSGSVLGEDIRSPERYLARVGAMIEGPAFYPMLSGRENLKVFADIGGFSLSRVDLLLDLVGLGARGGSKFKQYSLGMKQRLGIAAALLPNPQLLILDEPTNGLDPNGIQEIRNIILELASAGTSVFVSSHILAELEMISEYVVMLRKGEILYSGLTKELLANRRSITSVKPEYQVDLNRLVEIVTNLGYEAVVDEGTVHLWVNHDIGAFLNRSIREFGITLAEITTQKPTLEETFFEMTAGK